MRRVISFFVLSTLLLSQAAPGLCTAAASHAGPAHVAAAGASHDAGAAARHEAPIAGHDGHVAAHAHEQTVATVTAHAHAGATTPGAAQAPPEHDDSCHDVTRCHWAFVPASEAAAILDQPGPPHRIALSHDALDAAAAALLTPPPRLHS
ncbi:MAG TPA: hypothetical protein VK912_02745 [Longimicrobiales bacterium]|nr:hypothetical protein [Longimicrobiales bacterium]